MKKAKSCSSNKLFNDLVNAKDLLVLDVRNTFDSNTFKIECPTPFKKLNIPYFEFIEDQDRVFETIPRGFPIKIICSKEGSAKFVSELLTERGFDNVAYLSGGMNSWGSMLVPKQINPKSDGYKLYQFIRPGKGSCSYGVLNDDQLFLIDPSLNFEFYVSFAKSNSVRIEKIFETHLQADYISGSKTIAEKYGSTIVATDGDFKNSFLNYKGMGNGEIFEVGLNGPEIKVLFTPGHTIGSVCFILDNKYILSGDTIFIKSVGRPDLGGKINEWSKLLHNTLTEKIVALDGSLKLLPGHYMSWDESNDNFIFKKKLADVIELNKEVFNITNPEKFTQYIMDNWINPPKIYEEIRNINSCFIDIDYKRIGDIDLGKNQCAVSKPLK
tara:strand:+ start:13159 stop:14310 length:1152 start_codon:yes stop_codon:yes gene_type:complete